MDTFDHCDASIFLCIFKNPTEIDIDVYPKTWLWIGFIKKIVHFL